MKRAFERWFAGDRWLVLIFAVATMLGLAYNASIMPGFGPDEPRHLAYIKLLWEERSLPVLLPDGSEYKGAHPYHPPLYYVCSLPLYAIARLFNESTTYHLIRLENLVLGLASLLLIYQVALAAGGRAVARLATLTIAWLPMWGMGAGTVSNDPALFFAVSLFFWLLTVKYPEERSIRSAVILGLVMGLGTLSKATALLVDAVALIVYFLVQDGRTAVKSKNTWARGLTVAGIAILVAGWWHGRSMMLYGQFTLLPPPMPSPALPSPEMGKLVMAMHPNFPAHFAMANQSLFTTLWCQKDWLLMGAEPNALRDGIRNVIYLVFAIFTFGGLAGMLRRNNSDVKLPDDTAAKIARRAPIIAFVACWLTVLQVALFFHWGWAEGGRYLFPALCGVTMCAACGWALWTRGRLRFLTAVLGLFLLSVNGFALFWLHAYLNPTFGPK